MLLGIYLGLIPFEKLRLLSCKGGVILIYHRLLSTTFLTKLTAPEFLPRDHSHFDWMWQNCIRLPSMPSMEEETSRYEV